MEYHEELIARYKHERKRLGMSQKDVADKSGVSFNSVSKIEVSLRSPKVETFAKMCQAVGLSLVVVGIPPKYVEEDKKEKKPEPEEPQKKEIDWDNFEY